MAGNIYHEKQSKLLCALHTLNNLLQDGTAFKQEDLDKICKELDSKSLINPFKSVFGLGDYDISVIIKALKQKQLDAVHFDRRKDPHAELNFENIYGFILNVMSSYQVGGISLPMKGRHWLPIRNLTTPAEKENGITNYYNLDSKLDAPESIGSTNDLIEFLRSVLKPEETVLLVVVTEDISRLETWRRNSPSAQS